MDSVLAHTGALTPPSFSFTCPCSSQSAPHKHLLDSNVIFQHFLLASKICSWRLIVEIIFLKFWTFTSWELVNMPSLFLPVSTHSPTNLLKALHLNIHIIRPGMIRMIQACCLSIPMPHLNPDPSNLLFHFSCVTNQQTRFRGANSDSWKFLQKVIEVTGYSFSACFYTCVLV